ncbi:MAG: hypothetical protein U5R14_10355 [Gemmatimonadota bacterium]|nr:hypothetical protein [Gemmatimonadota bacterium]
MLVDTRRRTVVRITWTLILGFFLGGLLSKLAELLPDSVARDFVLTSVNASVGPLSVDLVAMAFELGPLVFTLNFLTLVGIAIVALVARSII